jgi:hypothetical protein
MGEHGGRHERVRPLPAPGPAGGDARRPHRGAAESADHPRGGPARPARGGARRGGWRPAGGVGARGPRATGPRLRSARLRRSGNRRGVPALVGLSASARGPRRRSGGALRCRPSRAAGAPSRRAGGGDRRHPQPEPVRARGGALAWTRAGGGRSARGERSGARHRRHRPPRVPRRRRGAGGRAGLRARRRLSASPPGAAPRGARARGRPLRAPARDAAVQVELPGAQPDHGRPGAHDGRGRGGGSERQPFPVM